MKLKIIGTSCTWFKRNNTSYVIDDDIILDMPSGAYKDIHNYTDIFKTRAVFISHFHTDHFADFHIICTQIMRYPGDRKEKLRVYGPAGILDRLIAFNTLMVAGDDEMSKEELTKNIEFIELEEGMEITEGKYHIKVFKMDHGKPESYGFVFDEKGGKTIGFSIDTKPCENLDKILSVSDVAFVDLAAAKPSKTHVCIDEFVELVKKFDRVKIYPIHTCDESQKFVEDNNMNPLHDGDLLEL